MTSRSWLKAARLDHLVKSERDETREACYGRPAMVTSSFKLLTWYAQWPRPFLLSPSDHGFWAHKLYRGRQDQPVHIMYSRTEVKPGKIAQEFANEKVVAWSGWDRITTTPML